MLRFFLFHKNWSASGCNLVDHYFCYFSLFIIHLILLAAMGLLAPVSVHAWHSAQPPIDTRVSDCTNLNNNPKMGEGGSPNNCVHLKSISEPYDNPFLEKSKPGKRGIRKREKMQLIVATTFCLPRPRPGQATSVGMSRSIKHGQTGREDSHRHERRTREKPFFVEK